MLLFAIGFEAVVRTRPNAVLVADFALALARATAGAVALVFDALRFRAQVGDVRQRAIATVAAVKSGDFERVLGRVKELGGLGVLG